MSPAGDAHIERLLVSKSRGDSADARCRAGPALEARGLGGPFPAAGMFPDAQDVHVGVVEDGHGLCGEDPAWRWPGGGLVDGVAAWWAGCRRLLGHRGAG